MVYDMMLSSVIQIGWPVIIACKARNDQPGAHRIIMRGIKQCKLIRTDSDRKDRLLGCAAGGKFGNSRADCKTEMVITWRPDR